MRTLLDSFGKEELVGAEEELLRTFFLRKYDKGADGVHLQHVPQNRALRILNYDF